MQCNLFCYAGDSMTKSRAQPPKKRLSRELIVEAGLELADELGADKVSSRNIANHLGVSSMAIYRHFDDMQDLQSEMLDRFTHRAAVLPEGDLRWDRWLVHVSGRMFSAMSSTPGWIALLGRVRLKPGALKVMDRGLAVLTKAGFSKHQAVEIFFVMNQAVIGAASLRTSLNNENREKSIPMDHFDPARFPDVYDCLPELLAVLRSDMLQTSVTWLIKALETELTANQSS
jgi:AcrR family transcriptional regulator